MSDLIDRQAAIDALRAAYWDDNIQSAKDDPCIVDAMTDWAIRQVKALPPSQPEIVRCKDCDWWTKQEDSLQGRCALLQMYPTGGWFCGNARRREETT